MKIIDLLTLDTIDLNVKADNKADILKQTIALMNKSGVITDINVYETGIFNREKESTTGVGDGVAIPHCKSNVVTKPHLAAMVIPQGVEFDSLDGQPVKLLFMIAAPDSKDNVHLDVLANLSKLLMDENFSKALIASKSKEEFLEIIDKFEKQGNVETKKDGIKYPDILAATACPTGIAHTYMAKEALEKAAAKKSITIKVETNGSGGRKFGLTDDEIAHAKAIIVAADAFVDMDRFAGKHLIQTGTSKAIKEPESLIDSALDEKCPIYKSNAKASNKEQSFGEKPSKFQIFYRHLMSGISHMIPFIVAGGILLAIAYIIDACCGNGSNPNFGTVSIGAQIFHMLGADLGLGLMLPVLGGFIAYSIAGKPGLVSGFIGAFAATKGKFNLMYFILLGTGQLPDWQDMLANNSAGFLGAIIAGFAAGYLVVAMKDKWFNKMPRTLEGIRDILIIPLLSTLIIGAGMLCVNVPLSLFNVGIQKGLMKLNELHLTLLLGALVSGLMAIDMGGPINKAAHYTVLAIMTQAISLKDPALYVVAKQLMAANIVGIMTPPVGIAIATFLFPQKFSKEDRKPSPANIVTGCCGITEGAIPYVMKDPIRVICSTVLGAAIGGLVAVLWGAEAIAPEGGVISMLSMGAICYKGIVSMLLGSIITALILGFIKKDVAIEESLLGIWKGIPFGLKDAKNKIHALNIKLANKKPEFNQILFDDYCERIDAIKKELDAKVADKKERLTQEKLASYQKKIDVKKAKLDSKLLSKKEQLQLAANQRKSNFNETAYKEYEAKVLAKIDLIKKNDALKQEKLAQKKATKLAKQKAKQESVQVQ